jgi:hypothetical protein
MGMEGKSILKSFENGDLTSYRPHPNHTSTNGTSRSHHENGRPLERYYLRGIIAILCPIIITAYWYIVWFVYLIPSDPGTDLFFGHSGAIYVFYSWFLIGIFGLGISEYGMVGIEASMMMEKRWAAKNAMQVMMHADQYVFFPYDKRRREAMSCFGSIPETTPLLSTFIHKVLC